MTRFKDPSARAGDEKEIGADLAVMKPVPLAAAHVDAIRAIGRERSYGAGDMIARLGDPMDRFLYVVEGEIEVVDPLSEERMGDAVLGPGQFVGELSFLSGGNYFLAMRAVSRTVTIEVAREAMLDLMAHVPELSDHDHHGIRRAAAAAHRAAHQFDQGYRIGP